MCLRRIEPTLVPFGLDTRRWPIAPRSCRRGCCARSREPKRSRGSAVELCRRVVDACSHSRQEQRERVLLRHGAVRGRDRDARRQGSTCPLEAPAERSGSGFADGGRAAQSAERDERAAPAVDPAVRLSDARRAAQTTSASASACRKSARAQREAAVERSEEPIAIVAMSCRFPAARTRPRALWQLLSKAPTRSSDFPRDRGWDVEALYDPDPDAVARARFATAVSCATPQSSTRRSSGSVRARRWPWIRSSACCSRPRGKRLERAGIDPSSLGSDSDGRVRRPVAERTTELARRARTGFGGLLGIGRVGERGVGSHRVQLGLQGPGACGGHGVFVVAGRAAPGMSVAASRRMRPGAGGRRDGDGDAEHVRRVQSSARPGAGRSLQSVFSGRGWHVVVGRRGDAGARAPVGRAAQGSSGVGAGSRLGGESRRPESGIDGAERSLAASGDPPGVGASGSARSGRGCGGSARHRHDAGRSDRSGSAARDVRRASAAQSGRCGWAR